MFPEDKPLILTQVIFYNYTPIRLFQKLNQLKRDAKGFNQLSSSFSKLKSSKSLSLPCQYRNISFISLHQRLLILKAVISHNLNILPQLDCCKSIGEEID